MADRIRVAVLGMAHDHLWTNLRQLEAVDGSELVAGADYDEALRAKFVADTGCATVFDDYDALLDDIEPDAVFVFSATAEHADIVELCAPRGIDVMVEKPMAATLEQADRMLVAARTHGSCLMVNWPTAWSRSWRTAKRLADEGAIGDVWQILWRGGHCGPDELGCSEHFCGFLFDPELNGAGAFNDYGGYGSSLCVWFLGSPQSVVGVAGRLLKRHLPVDDNGMMVLRYPKAMCRLEMTWTEAVAYRPAHDLVIYGSDGTLIAGDTDVEVFGRDKKEGVTVAFDDLPAGEKDGPTHFIESIRAGTEPRGLTNADLSRDAQEVMEAGFLSAVNGMTVSLPVEHHLFRG